MKSPRRTELPGVRAAFVPSLITMPTTTPETKTTGVQAACVTTLASTGPLSLRATESPADAATDEVPRQRLYYTTMIHFLSGFSRDDKAVNTDKS